MDSNKKWSASGVLVSSALEQHSVSQHEAEKCRTDRSRTEVFAPGKRLGMKRETTDIDPAVFGLSMSPRVVCIV